jgi:hypothetical protein
MVSASGRLDSLKICVCSLLYLMTTNIIFLACRETRKLILKKRSLSRRLLPVVLVAEIRTGYTANWEKREGHFSYQIMRHLENHNRTGDIDCKMIVKNYRMMVPMTRAQEDDSE